MTEVERLREALADIRKLASGAVLSRDHAAEIIAIADEALAPPQPTPDTRPVLTARQAEVLSYIRESIASRGYAPTVREIGARFGIGGNNGVVCHVDALKRKGYLTCVRNTARSFVPVEAS